MLDKYIKMNDKVIVSGQDGKTGMWYCKELPAETTKDTELKIAELNKIYNEANKKIEKERIKIKKKEEKEKNTPETLKKEKTVKG